MSERQITIRMPKESLAKWLAALRGGQYEQGIGFLRDGGNRYCCIGVLQHVVSGAVETDYADNPYCSSSLKWLAANGIAFDNCGPYPFPLLPKFGAHAGIVNDKGHSFAEIADAIEACAEGL